MTKKANKYIMDLLAYIPPKHHEYFKALNVSENFVVEVKDD